MLQNRIFLSFSKNTIYTRPNKCALKENKQILLNFPLQDFNSFIKPSKLSIIYFLPRLATSNTHLHITSNVEPHHWTRHLVSKKPNITDSKLLKSTLHSRTNINLISPPWHLEREFHQTTLQAPTQHIITLLQTQLTPPCFQQKLATC